MSLILGNFTFNFTPKSAKGDFFCYPLGAGVR